MSRKAEIQNAYKYLGKEATFYDGMITCSSIPGKAVCKVVWNTHSGIWFFIPRTERIVKTG